MQTLVDVPGVELGELEIDSVPWSFRRCGNGPPVVFLHGLAADAATWDHIEQRLGSAFHCVSVDLPGYSITQAGQPPLPLDALASGVCDLIRRLDLGVVSIVGHSLGGSVALMAAELGDVQFRDITLIAPAGFSKEIGRIVPAVSTRLGTAALAILHSKVVFRLLSSYVARQLARDPMFRSTAVAQAFEGLSRVNTRAARRQLRLSAAAAIRASRMASTPTSLGPNAASLPARIIWGSIDTVFPQADAEVAASHFSGASIAILDGAGHAPHRTHPDQLSKLLVAALAS